MTLDLIPLPENSPIVIVGKIANKAIDLTALILDLDEDINNSW